MSATEEYMAEAFRCLSASEGCAADGSAQVLAVQGIGYALLALVQQGQARPLPPDVPAEVYAQIKDPE